MDLFKLCLQYAPWVLLLIGAFLLFGETLVFAYRRFIGMALRPNVVVEIRRPRVEVLEKLDEVYEYFEDSGCAEGMAAIKVAIQHVYADHHE